MKIALITARANSIRIKNKNIKTFYGKPIIAYPIKVALSSKIFDRVIVSTDSREIANISLEYGASVPFLRPKTLSKNNIGTLEVIQHTINKILKNESNVDICCIYPVTPLLNKEIIIKSFKYFKITKSDFLVPVLKKKNERFLYLNKKGFIEEFEKKQKQVNVMDTGQFYWGTKKSFLKTKNIFSKKCKPYFIKKSRALDVNTNKDWEHLKKMYKKLIRIDT
tara:strand:+ start:538 stop:1203 length:666 start_codon:yes stop_codon:yes gene_type:complete